MKNKGSYRKEVRAVMLNKMTDCDEQIDKLIEEAKKILSSTYMNFTRIAEICQQVNTACCEKALLQELRLIKVPKRQKEHAEDGSPF